MEKDFITYISKIIERDLNKLEEEIKLYTSEESIWKVDDQIKNTAGNLCLHLCGNLQHYFGAVLGKSGYIRNRDNEFAAKGISRTDLISEIQKAKHAVKSTLEKIDTSILQQDYPEKVFDYSMTTSYFMIHLCSHLGYHLGQINYHRRLLS
jgi:uncharacterized damage-inducible protein DinB